MAGCCEWGNEHSRSLNAGVSSLAYEIASLEGFYCMERESE